jgi:hypothetical protein
MHQNRMSLCADTGSVNVSCMLCSELSSGLSETSVDNHFTRQYNPESEHHTRRRENLKSFMYVTHWHLTRIGWNIACCKSK